LVSRAEASSFRAHDSAWLKPDPPKEGEIFAGLGEFDRSWRGIWREVTELILTTSDGIKRAGPPQAIQKLREDFYLVQIVLSEIPSADWKRLFYETQQSPSPDFLPRSVDISGNLVKFRTEASSVEAKTAWVDRWIERANQKESGMGGRLEEERRRRRDEHLREQQELAAVNARWEKL
jgi:hypothetical protein